MNTHNYDDDTLFAEETVTWHKGQVAYFEKMLASEKNALSKAEAYLAELQHSVYIENNVLREIGL